MRRRPQPRVVLTWVALMALPLVLCLALAWLLSLQHYRDEAHTLAGTNARRVEQILASGARLVEEVAETTRGECDASTIAAMAQAVFHSVYFREAGIERDGNLVCTSIEMLPPGWDIPNAKRIPAARVGRLELLSPTKTIRGGKSIILNHPLRDDRSHFINLLLDPQQLVDVVARHRGLDAATLLDDTPNGILEALDGPLPAMLQGLTTPLAPGLHRGTHGFYAIARSGPWPLYSVVVVDDAVVAEHWRTQMRPAAVIGFLLSALGFLLLRRYLPQYSAEDDLRDGIAAGELLVEYQPILDARERRIVGAEALVRWQHPRRGRVPPDEFIPLAESSGLIEPLTAWVLGQVRRDLRALGTLPAGFRIGVNLARAHLASTQLLETVDAVFGAESRLDGLAFEVTERELLTNVVEQARATLAALVQRGAQVSLDDFGTGYSGLSHLRHLPLDHIKIDGSFIRALDTEAVTANLVANIVALAQSLDLGLVAEGVETEQQRSHLLALGVERQQGWLYSRAISLEDLQRVLAAG